MVLESFGQPLRLREFAVSPPEAGATVARVAYGGICGTDVHLAAGRLPMPTPVVMADVFGAPLAEGDRVVWASSIPCGRCYYCLLKEERTLCPNRRIYGINQPADAWPHLSGGWADRIYLQPGSTIVRIPDTVSFEEVIALGCAGPTVVHGVLHLLDIGVGDVVCVQGSGPVGLARRCTRNCAAPARSCCSVLRRTGSAWPAISAWRTS
jgi:D-arabinose 1-dehydrogenase-like Zn-dependent alcohol dehydrogenase